MLRKSFFIATVLLCGVVNAQPRAIPLKDSTSTSYMEGISSFNHVYVSLADLASALGLRTFMLGPTGKMSVYSGDGSMLFTPNNCFITISRGARSEHYQLPLPVIVVGNKLFGPANYLGQYFTTILHGVLTYDVSTGGFDFTVNDTLPPMITGVNVEQKDNGAVISISMSRVPTAAAAALGKDGILYVTIMPGTFDFETLNSLPPTAVYSNVLAIQNPNSVQLSFRLKQAYSGRQVFVDSTKNSVMVALYSKANSRTILSDELKARLDAEKKNWKLNVIVIDPGHGGKDPGALGLGGVKEKNVALAIAKDLKSDINQRLPGIKVVMTRDKDEFVPLDVRGQIADKAHGKLFISIHCNSMPRKPDPANGIETFFLRPGKNEGAIRIAARENAAIKYENNYEKKYKSYETDNWILTTMAHSAYVKYSQQFAELIEKDVTAITPLADDGVEQAGFIVLIGASMPAVLVETGYISNWHDVRILRSKRGQEEIAKGITDAIVQYKALYEKNFAQE